jgi:DNA-binding NtrC family response regulator
VLGDPTVSRYHLELTRGVGGVLVVDLGSTNGTYAGTVRIERAVIPPGTQLALGGTRVRISDGAARQVALHAADSLAGLRAASPVMRRLFTAIERVAQGSGAALVVGESGTGKELIARAIHELGPRSKGPFVTVDCGALPPNLIASELFGHEKGAFTGADRRHAGAFERAHGGTVFLDEIGELPAADQASLLGVLERRRFRRVGGSDELSVDVRVISATHRDLRAEVNSARFRLDLYYRIAVVTLRVAPLRDRTDDIPLLVEHFLRELGHAGDIADVVPPDTMADLMRHAWPGNVRELRNAIEALIVMGSAAELAALAPTATGARDLVEAVLDMPYKHARTAVMRDFEVRYLTRLLERAGGNVSAAARLADMDRSYLIGLLRRCGVTPAPSR